MVVWQNPKRGTVILSRWDPCANTIDAGHLKTDNADFSRFASQNSWYQRLGNIIHSVLHQWGNPTSSQHHKADGLYHGWFLRQKGLHAAYSSVEGSFQTLALAAVEHFDLVLLSFCGEPKLQDVTCR